MVALEDKGRAGSYGRLRDWLRRHWRLLHFESVAVIPTFGSCSVAGPHRPANEDRLYGSVSDGLFLVADGMGGHLGGAEASRIVSETVSAQLARDLARGPRDPAHIQQSLQVALDASRRRMATLATGQEDLQRMGATLALIVLSPDKFYTASIGDSRVYLYRSHQLRLLTEDQTLARELQQRGVLTAEQARHHPWRHYIVNVVGISKPCPPTPLAEHRMYPGDRLLLATDGLTNVVRDEKIAAILAEWINPSVAAEKLVAAALRNGTHDDATCVVVNLTGAPTIVRSDPRHGEAA